MLATETGLASGTGVNLVISIDHPYVAFTNTYADGLKMIGTSDKPRGVKFEGDKGSIFVHIHGGRLEAEPKSLLSEKIGAGETSLGRSPGHFRNFIDCVKSRKAPLATHEIGHRTGTICHLNNIAMLLGRKLRWEPDKEDFVGDDQASALVARPQRPGFEVAG